MLADPVGSVFTNFFKTGELGEGVKFLVEGVGKGNIPGCLNMSIVDGVVPVADGDAFRMCYTLAQSEGIFVGGSAGLNVHAAIEVAKTLEGPATVVTLLCDLGVKYLSKIYSDDWLLENGIDCSAESVAGDDTSSSSNSPRER
jgi:cystathionine beta-synthase